jgi:hypothetical protein
VGVDELKAAYAEKDARDELPQNRRLAYPVRELAQDFGAYED